MSRGRARKFSTPAASLAPLVVLPPRRVALRRGTATCTCVRSSRDFPNGADEMSSLPGTKGVFWFSIIGGALLITLGWRYPTSQSATWEQQQLFIEGRAAFRYDTFGDETFWGH